MIIIKIIMIIKWSIKIYQNLNYMNKITLNNIQIINIINNKYNKLKETNINIIIHHKMIIITNKMNIVNR
jgi:hypothetical protein